MSVKKKEFAIKDDFEKIERAKTPEYKKRHKQPLYLWQALGLSFLGAMCGGLIFFGIRWWLSIFSVLFFVFSGLGSYAFAYEFLREERRNKYQKWMVLVSDVVSVFLTLILVFTFIPDYAQDRVAKGHSLATALSEYLFANVQNNVIWIAGIIMAILGSLIAGFALKGFRRKK